jgi:nicotinamidase/pyrazinamidase
VKATALDANAAGFATVVVADASAAVNVQPADEARALAELRAAGIDIVQSEDITGNARVRG